MTIIARKWILASGVVAALMLSVLGAAVLAQGSGAVAFGSGTDAGVGDAGPEFGGHWHEGNDTAPPCNGTPPAMNDTARPLLTRAQSDELRNLTETMRSQNKTRDEIETAVQSATDSYMVANMESYNMTAQQIDLVMAKLDEVREQEVAIKNATAELRTQNLTREETRTQMQAMFGKLDQLNTELRDLLDQYDLRMPPMRGPMGSEGRGPRGGPGDCGRGMMPGNGRP